MSLPACSWREQKIVIVGAGLSGLATALLLRKEGVDVKVYEKDLSFRDRKQGYGLTLTNKAGGALDILEVLDECIHENCVSKAHYVFNPQGEIQGYYGRAFHNLFDNDEEEKDDGSMGKDDTHDTATPSLPISRSEKAEKSKNAEKSGNLRIPRQMLRHMLLKRLQSYDNEYSHHTTVEWGKKLVGYEETEHEVKVTFTNSTSKATDGEAVKQSVGEDGEEGVETEVVRCHILIGSDGLRSQVRELRDAQLLASTTTHRPISLISPTALGGPGSERVIPGGCERDEGCSGETKVGLKYLGVSVIIGLSHISHPLTQRQGFYVLDGKHRLFTMPFREATKNMEKGTEASTELCSGEEAGETGGAGSLHMWQLSFSGLSEQEAKELFFNNKATNEDEDAANIKTSMHNKERSKTSGSDLLAEALRRTNGWCSPVSQLITRTTPSLVWGTPLYDREPLWLHPSDTRGRQKGMAGGSRVTVIGDAAHPMSMFKGQGANQALEDAPLFVKWLKGRTSESHTTRKRKRKHRDILHTERDKEVAEQRKEEKDNAILSRQQLLTRLRCFEREMNQRVVPKQLASRESARRLHGLPWKEETQDGKGVSVVGERGGAWEFGFEGFVSEYKNSLMGDSHRLKENGGKVLPESTEGGSNGQKLAKEERRREEASLLQSFLSHLKARGVNARDGGALEEKIRAAMRDFQA